MGVDQYDPGVVVILDAQVVTGAEPEALRDRRQQPERHLLDASLQLGLLGELPASIGMVHGMEAVIPAVLGGKREWAGSRVDVCLQQLQLQPAGGRVIEPAIIESHGTAGLEIRCCIRAAF